CQNRLQRRTKKSKLLPKLSAKMVSNSLTLSGAYEYNLSLRELERLKAKIKLLLNPTESPSIKLVDFINDASSVATSGHSVIAACEAIISASQPILKNEWEKVKALQ
ncbi:hypothetical protein AAKU55_005206, partial [Oxalobacteraceae bacterium GrIS 1.11]